MTQLFDSSGRPVLLRGEIGRGGEGAVWETADPGVVAKVYHGPVEPTKVRKLSVMARAATQPLLRVAAWPTSTLHGRAGGPLVGILMPRIVGHREVHQLYTSADRRRYFPSADWSFLVHVAMNCAAAFETVHESGHVIGDVNQGGVLVSNQGTVHLIDCDSFQVTSGTSVFRCVVGVPHYTPPELQGASFDTVDRTSQHDVFGLALLVFHLLFMGRHPFAGRFNGPGDMPIERAIYEGRFAFSSRAASYQMRPPPHSPALDLAGPRIGGLFERAFARPANGSKRPAAREWREALADLKGSLVKCAEDASHRYPPSPHDCPWCAMEELGGPAYFTSVAATFDFDAGFDLIGTWSRIQRVRRPPKPTALAAPPPPRGIRPAPMPAEAQWERIGQLKAVPRPPALDPEPMPEVPVFEPDVVPDDPAFEPEPLPPLPVFREDDVSRGPDMKFRLAHRSADYLTAKWGTIVGLLVTIGMFWFPPACVGAAVVTVPFGITWAVYRRAALRERRRDRQRARQELAERREAHRHALDRAHAAQREVEAFNEALRAEWQQEVNRLQHLRESLPAVNARKHAAWQADVVRAQQRRAEAELANARRREAWERQTNAYRSELAAVELHNERVRQAQQARAAVRARRLDRLRALEREHGEIEQLWADAAAAYALEYETELRRLQRLKAEYDDLRGSFDEGRQQLMGHEADNQLRDYLRNTLIEDHKIPGIGPARQQTLASYGIETAFECHEDALDNVPGFGPQLVRDVIAWRDAKVRGFQYKPGQAVSPTELRALHMRYHSRRVALQRELRAGEERLQAIAGRGEQRLREVGGKLAALAPALAQAGADFRDC